MAEARLHSRTLALCWGVAAVLAEKQNIVFNLEIEFGFGSREIDVEQAYIEWKMKPEFAFRGGIKRE